MLWQIGKALALWYVGERRQSKVASRAGLSKRFRIAFSILGPTYIKLGQILSSGEGIFPPELVGEFRLLRDRVPPETFETSGAMVEVRLRPAARRGLRAVRHRADRRRLDRTGARAHDCARARTSS